MARQTPPNHAPRALTFPPSPTPRHCDRVDGRQHIYSGAACIRQRGESVHIPTLQLCWESTKMRINKRTFLRSCQVWHGGCS